MKLTPKTFVSLLLLYALGCASVTVDPEGEGDGDGDGDSSTGGVVLGNTGGIVVIGDGDGDNTGGVLIGDGDATGGVLIGDGDVATGGGSSTGGGAATGGGSSTGGSSGNVDCPTKVCGDGPVEISGSMCFTITVGQYGGWMVNSNDGCSIVVDGSPGISGQDITPNQPHEIEVSGCTHSYAAFDCYQ